MPRRVRFLPPRQADRTAEASTAVGSEVVGVAVGTEVVGAEVEGVDDGAEVVEKEHARLGHVDGLNGNELALGPFGSLDGTPDLTIHTTHMPGATTKTTPSPFFCLRRGFRFIPTYHPPRVSAATEGNGGIVFHDVVFFAPPPPSLIPCGEI